VTRAGEPVRVSVVGIGADGWSGLGRPAQLALGGAVTVIGAQRQLDLLPASIPAQRVPWPSPLLPALSGLLAEHSAGALVVLASGDPMFYGIGRAVVARLGAGAVTIVPHPSSVSLAAARLGWAVEECTDATTPALVANALRQWGFGPSAMTVLEQLGAAAERRLDGTADTWAHPPGDALNVLAVQCVSAGGGTRLSLTAGLDDTAYAHDGQLTKREVRAITLAVLAPSPGELLWDVGGGAGSIGIEWMRADRSCRAICVESETVRAQRIRGNADELGVPGIQIVTGAAPAALSGLPSPDAVFIGGGLTAAGLFDACWRALRPGGRLVANTVTLESEAVLAQWHAHLGGELRRIAVSRARPVGRYTGWEPAMSITQYNVTKPRTEQEPA